MSYGYIYTIENDVNGKLYVGQTVDPSTRWKAHRHKVLHTSAINKALKKYGVDSFDFVLLEACDSQYHLNEREVYWIETLSTISPHGYNLTGGGHSDVPGEETRRKMSAWQKGKKKLSEEQKKQISKFHQGKNVSKKTRTKISLNSPYRNRTHCPKGHPLDKGNTYVCTRKDGRKYRRCYICMKESNRRTYYRKKLSKTEGA